MSAPTIDIHLDDKILEELLFLAQHAGRIEQLVKLAGENPAGSGSSESVPYVAKKAGLPAGEVERLLSAVHTILRIQMRMRIDTARFLEAVTRSFEERANGASAGEDLTAWKAGVEVIREQLEKVGPDYPFSVEEWLAERAKSALMALRDSVEVSPGKHGGVPVLRGTRFTVAQLFAEIREGRSLIEIAADFGLDLELMKRLLEGFSMYLDRPLAK